MIALFILSVLKTQTVTDLVKDTVFDFTGNDTLIRVVNFYGKNCPACISAEPALEELSRMYWQEKRVRFAQLDCGIASDVCDSMNANNRPAWLVWFPGQSHSKRYNRDFDPEMFAKWVRQQTGIWPHSLAGDLLYATKEEFDQIKKKAQCIFAIFDSPRMNESQALHQAARNVEVNVRRGARFVAIDKSENADLAKKVGVSGKFGAYIYAKGKWTQYTGAPTEEAITTFINGSCSLVMATPTPTPEPMPELEDLPEEEFVPADDSKKIEDENESKKEDEKPKEHEEAKEQQKSGEEEKAAEEKPKESHSQKADEDEDSDWEI